MYKTGDQFFNEKFAWFPKYMNDINKYIWFKKYKEVSTWDGGKFIYYRSII